MSTLHFKAEILKTVLSMCGGMSLFANYGVTGPEDLEKGSQQKDNLEQP